MTETSDPKIVNRLNNLPPFDQVLPDDPKPEVVEDPKPEVENKPEEQPSVSERTKEQFEKLTESNRQLKEEVDQLKSKKNVLESLKPDENFVPQAPTTTPTQTNDLDGLVDADGYVDGEKLKQLAVMAKEASERARRAEESAKASEQKRIEEKRDFEESQLMRRLHEEYPEIDPKSPVYDATLYDAVRNELATRFTVGNNDIEGAVKKWHTILVKPKSNEKADEEAAKKANQKLQIQATSPGSTKNHQVQLDNDSLRKATIMGVKGSLAERLKRSGY